MCVVGEGGLSASVYMCSHHNESFFFMYYIITNAPNDAITVALLKCIQSSDGNRCYNLIM